MRRMVALLALGAIAAPVAHAHDPATIAVARLRAACAVASLPPAACDDAETVVRGAFTGLARTGGGISYADVRNETEHDRIEVQAGAFYFAPRVLEVDVGQVVTFRNTAAAGGNPHMVNSSDWLGSDRAVPVPGPMSWGGGAFTSGVLQPGQEWDWPMEPGGSGSGIPLGIDKVLIPYHCNIHGAAQMSGFLLLRTREY